MTGPVLITGGAGFIGCNLANRLASDGHEVLVFDALSRAGVDRNLAWLKERHPDRIRSVVADVGDADAVAAAVADVSVVFHLAAQVAVTTSLVDPVADFDTNVRGTLNLLEALRRRNDGTPLIFASTNKVYGDLTDIPLAAVGDAYLPLDQNIRTQGVGEDRPLDFHTPYGCSKGAADQYVLDYARSFDVPTCVMRMSCIYGPWQMGTEDQGWVAHFLIRALAGKAISVFGDGCQVRDILHVRDAIGAYVAAWREIDRVRGRAFNLGGGPDNAVSLRQLIAHIEALVGHAVSTEFSDWRAGDQRYFVADTTAVRRELRLPRPIEWHDGVSDLADWLRQTRSTPRRSIPAATAPRSAPPPLRLLMTADAVGGVWTYALDLAGALSSLGVETTLVTLGPRPDAAGRAAAHAVPNLQLIETDLPLDWTAESPAAVRGAGAEIAALARHARADLVQLNSPALAAGTSFPVPVVGACHSCLATWWEAVRGGAMPEDFRWRTDLTREGLASCDTLVAPTAAFAEATAAAYSVPAPRTVHNGRHAAPASAMARARQVFTAGRLWDEGKNIAALDAAAALIDAPVLAAGPLDGPNGTRVALSHARPLGLLSLDEMRARFGGSLVFATAALYEPFGLAVLEAAQAGCALVVSDIPTLRELWQDAAVFVPPRDPAAIAEALQALLDAPGRAAALGAAAQARASRYSAPHMAEAMRSVYDNLLAARMPGKRAEAAA